MAVNFAKVSVKEKIFSVSDFRAIKGKCVNLCAKKDGLYPALLPGIKTENNPTVFSPLRTYKIGNDRYVYTSEGKVRAFVSGNFLQGATFLSTPELKSVVIDGEKRYYLVSDDKSYSFSSGGTSAFSGKFFTFFGNSVFVIKNGALKFSLPFDFTDSSGNLKATESYSPEKNIGEAIAISHDYDKLYILCEKGLVAADFNDAPEKYLFKGVEYDDLSVIADSAAVYGDKIFFMSGDDFCVARGGKIEKLSSPLKDRDFGLIGAPFCYKGTYFIEIHFDFDNGSGKYLAVDAESGEFCFLSVAGFTFCDRENGIVYRAADNAFYYHDEDAGVLSAERSFKSKPLSFGSAGLKRIVGFSAYSEGDPVVRITGDNGSFTFSLKDGYDSKRANVSGREFYIEISNNERFALKDLKIKYTED